MSNTDADTMPPTKPGPQPHNRICGTLDQQMQRARAAAAHQEVDSRQATKRDLRRLARLLRARPRAFRRLLLALLAEPITSIAQAVAEEHHGT